MAYLNPFVKEVAIYDLNKQLVDRDSRFPDPVTNASLDSIIAERRSFVIDNSGDETKTSFLFVDLHDSRYGSDVSRIVRITYDKSQIQKQLNTRLLAHFIAAIFFILLGIIAAILVSRFLARPVYQIVSDVNQIAKGDLTHKISPTIGSKFVLLEESVNTMVVTLSDTIEREKKGEERYRHLIENIPDAIWTSTPEGQTIFISRNVEELYGYTQEEICKRGTALFFDRIHPEDREKVKTAWELLFKEKRFDMEYRIQHRNGSWIWLHDRSTTVYEQDGTWFADGIISNITPRKEVEQKLREFYTELEQRVIQRTSDLKRTEDAFKQANKKLNLLSSITRHDILNQLTILTGYIKLADSRTSDTEAKKFLSTAQKAADVIDRHMAFTRLYQNVGIHTPAWQNVEHVIENARKDLPRDTLHYAIETGDLELFADPLLEKVFFTLVENTLRHGEHATEVRVTSIPTDEGMTLIYEDNGIGIPPTRKRGSLNGDTGNIPDSDSSCPAKSSRLPAYRYERRGRPGRAHGLKFLFLQTLTVLYRQNKKNYFPSSPSDSRLRIWYRTIGSISLWLSGPVRMITLLIPLLTIILEQRKQGQI